MKLNYFITGGTGSFAKHYSEYLIKNKLAKKIVIFSRDEYKQSIMKDHDYVKKNLKIFRFFIGDVRDKERLDWAINHDIDIVVHSAALKQVPTTEYNPFETVKTNIIGSQNVIEVCIKKNVKKGVLVSTDKAVSPLNLYGSTKLTAEKLFISANMFKGQSNLKLSVVRYGNVMGSRGSVVPLLIEQNLKNKYFTITDKRMTRFNIDLDSAVKFVADAIYSMQGGEIFVPKLKSYNIIDLAKAINPNKKIKIIGIRKGEKIHEELLNSSEFQNTIETKNNFKILPLKNFKIRDIKHNSSYNSFDNRPYLTVNQLKLLIKNNKSYF
jgi:UDP-N-acetylglucosamine 4,6-dehydratase/5-epimerase